MRSSLRPRGPVCETPETPTSSTIHAGATPPILRPSHGLSLEFARSSHSATRSQWRPDTRCTSREGEAAVFAHSTSNAKTIPSTRGVSQVKQSVCAFCLRSSVPSQFSKQAGVSGGLRVRLELTNCDGQTLLNMGSLSGALEVYAKREPVSAKSNLQVWTLRWSVLGGKSNGRLATTPRSSQDFSASKQRDSGVLFVTMLSLSALPPNARGQAGRAKRVQHATKRRARPCLHRACCVPGMPGRLSGTLRERTSFLKPHQA
jgi:hypothetical protein